MMEWRQKTKLQKSERATDSNTLTGNGRTNTWDSQNRLVSCLINGNTTTYRYGADGLRRQSTKNGVSTDSAYDGTMMVWEGHAAGGSLTASTVTATYFIGARGPEYRRDDTATELDSQGRTVTKARWYVFDGLGSVVGEVDPLGNLTSSPKYDVYGATRSNGGAASSKQGFVGSLGHVSDDTGLVYMRARYMDPQTGRFISEDPIANGTNWFVYAESNPVNCIDATGKESLGESALSMGISATLSGLSGAAFSCVSQYLTTGSIDSIQVAKDFFGGFALGLLGGAGYVAAAGSKIEALKDIAGALACVVSAKNFALAAMIFSGAGGSAGAISVGINSIIAHVTQVSLMLMSTDMEDD